MSLQISGLGEIGPLQRVRPGEEPDLNLVIGAQPSHALVQHVPYSESRNNGDGSIRMGRRSTMQLLGAH